MLRAIDILIRPAMPILPHFRDHNLVVRCTERKFFNLRFDLKEKEHKASPDTYKQIKYVTNLPKFLTEWDIDDQRVIIYGDKEDIIRTQLNLHSHSDVPWHRYYHNDKKNLTTYRPGSYNYYDFKMYLCENGAEGEPDQIDW